MSTDFSLRTQDFNYALLQEFGKKPKRIEFKRDSNTAQFMQWQHRLVETSMKNPTFLAFKLILYVQFWYCIELLWATKQT